MELNNTVIMEHKRTDDSLPSQQQAALPEEVVKRIIELRAEKQRLKTELADSHMKIKKLASEVLSLQHSVGTLFQYIVCVTYCISVD